MRWQDNDKPIGLSSGKVPTGSLPKSCKSSACSRCRWSQLLLGRQSRPPGDIQTLGLHRSWAWRQLLTWSSRRSGHLWPWPCHSWSSSSSSHHQMACPRWPGAAQESCSPSPDMPEQHSQHPESCLCLCLFHGHAHGLCHWHRHQPAGLVQPARLVPRWTHHCH